MAPVGQPDAVAPAAAIGDDRKAGGIEADGDIVRRDAGGEFDDVAGIAVVDDILAIADREAIDVGPGIAVKRVVAGAAGDEIRGPAGLDEIVPGIAEHGLDVGIVVDRLDPVVAVAAVDDIRALPGIDDIVAAQPVDLVGAGGAADDVVALGRVGADQRVEVGGTPFGAVGEAEGIGPGIVGRPGVGVDRVHQGDEVAVLPGADDEVVAAPLDREIGGEDAVAQHQNVAVVAVVEDPHPPVAGIEDIGVGARPAAKFVAAGAARQRIVAVAALENVGPGPAGQHIVARQPFDHVVARARVDGIAVGRAGNGVVAVGALHRHFDQLRRGPHGAIVEAQFLDPGNGAVEGVGDDDLVAARADGDDQVGRIRALPHADVGHRNSRAQHDRIRSVEVENGQRAVAGGEAVGLVTLQIGHAVDAGSAIDHVVAAAAVEHVVARQAAQFVRALFAAQGVVFGRALDHIVGGGAGDGFRIGQDAARDDLFAGPFRAVGKADAAEVIIVLCAVQIGDAVVRADHLDHQVERNARIVFHADIGRRDGVIELDDVRRAPAIVVVDDVLAEPGAEHVGVARAVARQVIVARAAFQPVRTPAAGQRVVAAIAGQVSSAVGHGDDIVAFAAFLVLVGCGDVIVFVEARPGQDIGCRPHRAVGEADLVHAGLFVIVHVVDHDHVAGGGVVQAHVAPVVGGDNDVARRHAGVEHDGAGVRTAAHRIDFVQPVAGGEVEFRAARPVFQVIRPLAADEDVEAVAACEVVETAQADQRVVAGFGPDLVVAFRAGQDLARAAGRTGDEGVVVHDLDRGQHVFPQDVRAAVLEGDAVEDRHAGPGNLARRLVVAGVERGVGDVVFARDDVQAVAVNARALPHELQVFGAEARGEMQRVGGAARGRIAPGFAEIVEAEAGAEDVGVVAFLAVEVVPAGPAFEDVVAVAAIQVIVPAPAAQRIVARIAVDAVIGRTAFEHIVVGDRRGDDLAVLVERNGGSDQIALNDHGAVVEADFGHAGFRARIRAAHDPYPVGCTGEAEHQVEAVLLDLQIARQQSAAEDDGVHAAIVGDRVLPETGVQHIGVGPGAARHGVVADAARQRIVARLPGQRVVSGKAVQHAGGFERDDGVVPVAALDQVGCAGAAGHGDADGLVHRHRHQLGVAQRHALGEDDVLDVIVAAHERIGDADAVVAVQEAEDQVLAIGGDFHHQLAGAEADVEFDAVGIAAARPAVIADDVLAEAGCEAVGVDARTAGQHVVADPADDDVGAARHGDAVVARAAVVETRDTAAGDDVVAVVHDHRGELLARQLAAIGETDERDGAVILFEVADQDAVVGARHRDGEVARARTFEHQIARGNSFAELDDAEFGRVPAIVVDDVLAETCLEHIGVETFAADQLVVARAAHDAVRALAGVDGVVAVAAVQRVVFGGAVDRVVARRALRRGERHGEARQVVRGTVGKTQRFYVVAGRIDEIVDQDGIARADHPDQQVVIVDLREFQVGQRDAGTEADRVDAAIVVDGVAAEARFEHIGVVVAAARKPVVAAPAGQDVVAIAAVQRVVPVAAVQHIGLVTAGHRVVAIGGHEGERAQCGGIEHGAVRELDEFDAVGGGGEREL